MIPHHHIDPARLSRHGSGKKGIVVAVNIAAKAGAFVLPSKGVVHVVVPATAPVTVGHDCGTLR
jgi:hypothetical protein